MTIKLDKSPNSVLAYCTLCGWRDILTTTLAARRAGADHERRSHPTERTAYNSFWRATRRANLGLA